MITSLRREKESPAPTNSWRSKADANMAMRVQPSFNIDGEKQLKQALLPLYDMQKMGKEIKASVLTRWLGDDIDYYKSLSTDASEVDAWRMEIERRKVKERGEPWFDLHRPEAMDTNCLADTGIERQGDGEESQKKYMMLDDHIKKESKGEGRVSSTIAKLVNPPPTELAGSDASVLQNTTIGAHNPHSDAIFAFAEGYDLRIYLGLVESLKASNFSGDLVLSVSVLDQLQPGVEEYLRSTQDKGSINVVVYTVPWTCFDRQGNMVKGTREGIHMCQVKGMYGARQEQGRMEALSDPRTTRPVATARYELYWIWSLNYEGDRWIMLIDTRDVYFQKDPFQGVERRNNASGKSRKTRSKIEAGLLYLFAENAEANTIGGSTFNRNWLITAYGENNVKSYFSFPILCSGSTMGERIAIEAYLRAMVAQFDRTQCKAKGCDQGFHNYLYYSQSLLNMRGIEKVVVYEQGKGIINNLGLLRNKPLREWGIFDTVSGNVLNWDGTVSPVAHQIDRDDELNKVVKERRKAFEQTWREFSDTGTAETIVAEFDKHSESSAVKIG